MSFEAARSDIVGAAEVAKAAWAGVPSTLLVEYDNLRLIDVDKQVEPYVCVEINYIEGKQLSLGLVKTVADYGQIHVVVHTPAGAGSLVAKKLLDHFRAYFELKTFSVVRTRAAMGAPTFPKDGWECTPLIVPFWVHRLVT